MWTVKANASSMSQHNNIKVRMHCDKIGLR